MDNIKNYNKNIDRRTFFINHTRHILETRKIKFVEEDAESGSHYFKISLNNGMSPCIRISDHLQHNKVRDPFTMLYNASKNAKAKDLKKRIERSVDNILERSAKASLLIKLNNI